MVCLPYSGKTLQRDNLKMLLNFRNSSYCFMPNSQRRVKCSPLKSHTFPIKRKRTKKTNLQRDNHYHNCHYIAVFILQSPRWLSGRAFASHAGDRGSIPGRNRPKSLKQAVSTPMLSARQQVRVSWVLGDDHYKQMTRVTCIVGVER